MEFAIWGPFDGRSAKLRQFHDHILTRDGSWQYRLLRGPSTFSQWEASWNVFAAACIMLDVAKFGELQQYRSGIKRLNDLFPGEWATVALLDEEMRSELWPRLYEEIIDGTRPEPRGFNRNQPWGTIMSESRFDYLQGPLADHWRRKEVQLERAARVKPAAKSIGEAPGATSAPPPPSHQTALGVVSPGWGSGRASRNPAPKAHGVEQDCTQESEQGRCSSCRSRGSEPSAQGQRQRQGEAQDHVLDLRRRPPAEELPEVQRQQAERWR